MKLITKCKKLARRKNKVTTRFFSRNQRKYDITFQCKQYQDAINYNILKLAWKQPYILIQAA